MDLPPLTSRIFSSQPDVEKFYRCLCLAITVAIFLALVIFWVPLRDTYYTYLLVSVTVTNPLVFAFFSFVTVLGSEGFFLVMLAVVYWSVHKSLGFWGLIIMPLAIFTTSEIPKDIVRLPRPDIRGVTVPTYTFPSGHTSGAVSVWGYLAIMIKNRRFWFWSLLIIILVGLSRVMLGYHFPGDVLGGIVTGVAFLAIFFGAGLNLSAYHYQKSLSFPVLLFFSLAIPLALSLIPATYAPNLMGYLGGAASGRLFERERIGFDVCGSRAQHLLRALIGLSLVFLIIPGINAIFPHKVGILTFMQHFVSTFWITYLAPAVFIGLGLTTRGTKGDNNENAQV